MITSIHYKNFKALRDATLPLGRFTLIVGANGTGKSSAMQGLGMIAKNPRNSKEIATFESKEEVEIEVSWNIGFNTKYKKSWLDVDGGMRMPEGLVYDNKVITDYKLRENILEPLRQFQSFSFAPEELAKPTVLQSKIKLDASGKNLAGILDQLQNSEPERFEELNKELNRWFYEYDRILFEVPADGQKSFLLRTTVGKHKIKASELSDGTLLALAYLTIAYLPNPPKIVAFEEPEKGIHPRLLRNIQEAMYRLAYPENYGENREPIQVIATTHSPYLLDLFKDNPEEIVIAEKDENGVHFENLAKMKNIDKILQGGESLGEVWFTGVLGGVPAHI